MSSPAWSASWSGIGRSLRAKRAASPSARTVQAESLLFPHGTARSTIRRARSSVLGQLFRVTCGDQPIGCGVVGVVDVDAHRVLRPGTDLEEGTGVEIDSASLLRRFALVSGR